MSNTKPEPNADVTSASGYEVEGKVTKRFANGWGGSQTMLKKGHLARRDSSSEAKSGASEK